MTARIYEEITSRIVAQLEAGVAPWVKPWTVGESTGSVARNAHTGKPYRGINRLMLDLAGLAYDGPAVWCTYKQAVDMGGHVRRGEHGTRIVFWGSAEPRAAGGGDDDGERQSYTFARAYSVFHASQIEAVDLARLYRHLPPADVRPKAERDEGVAAFVRDTGAKLTHGGDRAYYHPESDAIRMPEVGAFASAPEYSATLLHELTHWTGHKSRCARDLRGRFGDASYAAEELIAEMGAAFLCGDLGVAGRLQHAEYIGSWIKVLRADARAIFTAASQAQKAADFLHATVAATRGREVRAA